MIGTVINSFVHIIMYSYYFLAALGPKMRKHLWWKKYLTRIQIVSKTFHSVRQYTCLVNNVQFSDTVYNRHNVLRQSDRV